MLLIATDTEARVGSGKSMDSSGTLNVFMQACGEASQALTLRIAQCRNATIRSALGWLAELSPRQFVIGYLGHLTQLWCSTAWSDAGGQAEQIKCIPDPQYLECEREGYESERSSAELKRL